MSGICRAGTFVLVIGDGAKAGQCYRKAKKRQEAG